MRAGQVSTRALKGETAAICLHVRSGALRLPSCDLLELALQAARGSAWARSRLDLRDGKTGMLLG